MSTGLSSMFLHYMQGLCKAFAAGCSYDQPFKLLLYSDEIVPGNPLRPHSFQKGLGVLCIHC